MPTPPAASARWCSTSALEGAPSTVIASFAAALMNRLRSVIGPIRTGSNGDEATLTGRPGLCPGPAGAVGPRPRFVYSETGIGSESIGQVQGLQACHPSLRGARPLQPVMDAPGAH